MSDRLNFYWTLSIGALFEELKASAAGLTREEAQRRLAQYGVKRIKAKSRTAFFLSISSQRKW